MKRKAGVQFSSPKPGKRHKKSMDECSDVENWDTNKLCQYLSEKGLGELQEVFHQEQINGGAFLMLTEPLLEKLGIGAMGKRLAVMRLVQRLGGAASAVSAPAQIPDKAFKVFNDPIHGHIELHPLFIKIVDTPQFQRLRYIKQLGGCYYVFPGGCHNRFEHSIGTCHLAGQLMQAIKSRQPELNLTEQDILCVQIAGLCHDLGHGPFSHVYDGKFMPAVRPEKTWKHEDLSVKMFDHLVEVNNLVPEFEKYGLGHRDLIFIKEQIAGPPDHMQRPGQSWQYLGREQDKSFMYEIVSNKRNGIDVDKWDYFARDCHQLGISNNFDHVRFMKFARVLEVEGQKQICSRDKEVGNLYDLFHTRNALHRRAYQHKTARIVEEMITEALVKANDHIQIRGKQGQLLRLSDCVEDMVAYSKLTDTLYQQILYSDDPNLAEAQEVLMKIETRQLYKSVGQTKPRQGVIVSMGDRAAMKAELVKAVTKEELAKIDCDPLQASDIVVQVITMDYGMREKNPIDHVRFYMKDVPDKAFVLRKDQVSEMLPETFWEQHIRVFCKKTDDASFRAAVTCFHAWCKQRKFAEPKGGDLLPVELTPIKGTPERPVKAASFPGAHRKINM